jgi:hypothetical protein
MEMMTSGWTDERMDDLKHQVDELSRRTEDGFRDMRREMDSRFNGVDARLDAMNERFDGMQRTLIMFGAAMFAAMIGLIATQLGLILLYR